ncbi:MAG: hypothetical protein H6737_31770 [Alphaproteobacteria bacterium]|nr:hypothetical protein [Alphaproteobacteria bacterium]
MLASQLPIEEPCSADWGAMSGDERRRFCGQCSKHVHHLSAMTEREAEKVLEDAEVCVRYEVDRDARIVFRPSRRARARAFVAAAVLASTPAFASGQAAEEPGILARLYDWLVGDVAEDVEPASPPEDAIPEVQDVPVEVPVPHVDTGIVPPDPKDRKMPPLMGRPAQRMPPAQTLPKTR